MDIVAENVGYIYGVGTPFEKQALHNVNFRIKSGSFTGIIGHTGSGKSTLIQHFNGLLRPTEGTLRIGDTSITASSKQLGQLRRRVGMVFQYPEHQLFEETVVRDIAFGPNNLQLPPDEINERVQSAMKLVGLDYERVAKKSPFQLSGGQMRRVAIAGVLAMQPQVLVLDEPTAGLDPKGKEEILQTIVQLKKSLGMTVVFVSHSMEDVARFADHLLVLHEGTVVLEGSPLTIFQKQTQLDSYGLDVPYVLRWLQDVNRFITPPIPLAMYTEVQLAEEIVTRWRERMDLS